MLVSIGMKVSFAPRPSAEVCHLPLEVVTAALPSGAGSTGTAGKEQLFPANAVILRDSAGGTAFSKHTVSRAQEHELALARKEAVVADG